MPLTGFVVGAGLTEGVVAYAVTSSFAQALIVCIVGGVIVAVGQIVSAYVTAKNQQEVKDSIEEAKHMNRLNREILQDIQKSANLARRRTDKLDDRGHDA